MLPNKAGWLSVLQEANHCGNLSLIINELKKIYDFFLSTAVLQKKTILKVIIKSSKLKWNSENQAVCDKMWFVWFV